MKKCCVGGDGFSPAGGGSASGWTGVQVYFVGKHGNDSNTGLNWGRPFLTFGAAVAAATALTPASDNRFLIACLDAGDYAETVTLAQWISIFAPDASVDAINYAEDSCAWVRVAGNQEIHLDGSGPVIRTPDSAGAAPYLNYILGDSSGANGAGWTVNLGTGAAGFLGGPFNLFCGDGGTGGGVSVTCGDSTDPAAVGGATAFTCGDGDQGGAFDVRSGTGNATLGGGGSFIGGNGVTGSQNWTTRTGNCTGAASIAGACEAFPGDSTGANGTGGALNYAAGDCTAAGGSGGNANFGGGAGEAQGGAANLNAGQAVNGNGGNCGTSAGGSTTTGNGGNWSGTAGGAQTGNGGNWNGLAGGTGTAGNGGSWQGFAGFAGGASGDGGDWTGGAGNSVNDDGGDARLQAGTGGTNNGVLELGVGASDACVLGDEATASWAGAADGDVLSYDLASGRAEWRDQAAILHFGASNSGVTTTKRYLFPGGADAVALTSNVLRIRAPRTGTLRRMYVRHNVPAAAAVNITYTLELDGVATALAVTLAANVASGSDTVNSVAVAADQDIAIAFTKAGAVAGGVDYPQVTLEYV